MDFNLESRYTFKISIGSDGHESSVALSCSAITEVSMSRENPCPTHITCVIGLREVYDEVIFVQNHLEQLKDPRADALRSILFLVPNNMKTSE